MGRCPQCGQGKLFRISLKPVEACAACGEKFGHIRVDDGATWLTILVVGHISVPITVALAMETSLSDGSLTMICIGLVSALTYLLLPRAKGVMLAMIWRTRCSGS